MVGSFLQLWTYRDGGLQVDPLVVPDSLFPITYKFQTVPCRPTCFEDVFAYNIGGHGDKTSGVHRSAGVFPLSLFIGRS